MNPVLPVKPVTNLLLREKCAQALLTPVLATSQNTGTLINGRMVNVKKTATSQGLNNATLRRYVLTEGLDQNRPELKV